MSDWDRIDPPATAFGWPNAWLHSLLCGIASDLPAMATEKGMHAAVGEALMRLRDERKAATAEIERLKAELAESQERRLGWAAEVGKLSARRAELRELLGFARTAIQNGFMDGQWATIVQTQKELLPSVAVMESKHAEVVINAIEKALRPKERA